MTRKKIMANTNTEASKAFTGFQKMIGSGVVNTILGRSSNDRKTGKYLLEVLSSVGIEAVGIDNSGWPLWFESQIIGSEKRINDAIDPPAKIESPIQKENAQQKTLSEGLVAGEVMYRLAPWLDSADEEFGVLKKQGQEIIRLCGDLDKTNTVEISKESETRMTGELASFIGSYMADQQRILSQQIDSALSSFDVKIDNIFKAITGQGRAIGDVKSGMADINRQQNSLISNVYTTQKATREEILKGLSRVESAIDGR